MMLAAIKFCVCTVLCVFFVLPLAVAETSVSLELYDVNTRQQIKNVVTDVTVTSANTEINFNKYILTNSLTFRSDEGLFTVTLRIDDLATEGKDYFLSDTIEIREGMSEKVYLYSVGSFRGTVIDELNNLVSNAELKFECSADYGDRYPLKTDKFGAFSLSYAPIGTCKITAFHKNAIGSVTVNIERGKSSDLEIKLEQRTATSNTVLYSIGATIIALLIIGMVFLRKKPQTRTKRKDAKVPAHSQRVNDIVKTLREKEKAVVETLLQSSGASTQAKIRTATGMPKTSLARVLETLRAKNIVEIEVLGKLKKVRLTKWFLGTEK